MAIVIAFLNRYQFFTKCMDFEWNSELQTAILWDTEGTKFNPIIVKWHWDRFFSEHFDFPLPVIIPSMPHAHQFRGQYHRPVWSCSTNGFSPHSLQLKKENKTGTMNYQWGFFIVWSHAHFLVCRKSKIGYKKLWRISWRRARTKMITKIVKGIETGR
jgi:hypothetical protein